MPVGESFGTDIKRCKYRRISHHGSMVDNLRRRNIEQYLTNGHTCNGNLYPCSQLYGNRYLNINHQCPRRLFCYQRDKDDQCQSIGDSHSWRTG